ncbi:3,4-dihydroxy-2-butanone 4-phosphate synthase / GTP cyclohydrolase II [hydrothermal vent metagenome]|uniref:GTP cyclohydrolase II n=1 Tax=hydrothermal vent metagenome TaxID=652676 RepID=A0A3B0TT45_9ZZZZ
MSSLSKALTALQSGKMIILVDDEDRENEGDLIVAAQFATPQAVNFMAMEGRGLICLALEGDQIDNLGLSPMVADNQGRRSTAFSVSIEAREGVTTGISAHDRSRTIMAATNPDAVKGDVVSPGHIFPLRAAHGGVLARNGHTEGSTDLVRMAGLNPGAVICEIMRDDGHMARRDDLAAFAKKHDLEIITIKDIIEHRQTNEQLVKEVACADLPSAFSGTKMKIYAFESLVDGSEHLALVKYPLSDNPLVRVHSECLTGDALGSLRCDCGAQLQEGLRRISQSEGGGALVYLRGHEGRGIGLANKIRAYALQDMGQDTFEANTSLGFAPDARDYGIGAQILKALKINKLRLLSNNPQKAKALERHGIVVAQQLALTIEPNPHNLNYLNTKREKFGHTLSH